MIINEYVGWILKIITIDDDVAINYKRESTDLVRKECTY